MFEAALSYAMLSDPGRVRQRNEDACAADPEHRVFVVCDGVGGAAGGEVASQLAAKTFVGQVAATLDAKTRPDTGYEAGLELDLDATLESALRDGVEFANSTVYGQSHEQAELFGMATTMVAMLFHPHPEAAGEATGTVWLANIGDSRCYRLRKGVLEQLTHDHSLVGEQVRLGLMTREQAEASPIRNVITRAVGSESAVEADVQRLAALRGDLFLLASDGLTRELSDEDVADVLRGAEASGVEPLELGPVCAELVRRANEKGGGDNITCLLVRIR